MDKTRKLELVQRLLALKHKLKVHESVKQPDSHEEFASMVIAKWELEDELRAIEEILDEARRQNIVTKRVHIEKEGPKKKSIEAESEARITTTKKMKKK